MEVLENGKGKLEEICEILRKETIEPAQNDAKEIIDKAKEEAQKIIDQANNEAKNILDQAHAQIEQDKKLFENSIELAAKQSFDQLRQKVEEHFFNLELTQLAEKVLSQEELVAKLIGATIGAIEKEGLGSNIAISLSKNISPEEVSRYLAKDLTQKISKNPLPVEQARAEVKLVDQQMKVDISTDSLKELMGSFLRDSFRDILFKNA